MAFFYSIFFDVKARDLSFSKHFQAYLYLAWLFFYARKHFDIRGTTSEIQCHFSIIFEREPLGKRVKCPIFKLAQKNFFCSYTNVNHMKTLLIEQEKQIIIVRTCYCNVMNIVEQYKVGPNFVKNSS